VPRLARAVALRPIAATDAAAFVAAVAASRALHGRWVHLPDTRAAFRRMLERQRAAPDRISLLAVRRSDAALLGVFNFSEIVRGPLQQAFLGYYAFAPHAGRGYMHAGLERALTYAFGALKLHRIEANIQPDNAPSLALARAAGFNREGFSPRYLKIGGRWRDHERWAINADQWRERRRRGARG
jgi:ribosomal-protein-alanine N-acetyltransferase